MCIRDRFKTSIGQVYGAFKEIGFTDVIEVAEGAMATTSNEAHELLEKLEEVRSLLDKNEIMQALNAAPLWKYIARCV